MTSMHLMLYVIKLKFFLRCYYIYGRLLHLGPLHTQHKHTGYSIMPL